MSRFGSEGAGSELVVAERQRGISDGGIIEFVVGRGETAPCGLCW
jgi:hypothetical protein